MVLAILYKGSNVLQELGVCMFVLHFWVQELLSDWDREQALSVAMLVQLEESAAAIPVSSALLLVLIIPLLRSEREWKCWRMVCTLLLQSAGD